MSDQQSADTTAQTPQDTASQALARPSLAELTMATVELARKEPPKEEPAVEPKPAPTAKDAKAAKVEADITARLADVSAQAREARAEAKRAAAAVAAAETRAKETEAKLLQAETDAKELAALRADMQTDPLKAFNRLGAPWKDIVKRVATFEEKGDTDEARAAKAANETVLAEVKAAKELVEKLQKERNDERRIAAEQTAIANSQAEERAAIAFVAKVITSNPDAFPRLAAVDNVAAEVVGMLNEAYEAAKKANGGAEIEYSKQELDALISEALTSLENSYADLGKKLDEAGKPKPKPTEAQGTKAEATESEIVTLARAKRTPRTITARVTGKLPEAQNRRPMSASEAKAEALKLARTLPQ